jgi:hypothetical protein
MRTIGLTGILCLVMLLAGCIRLPGIPVISDTPDPLVGQWIGGEPPETDLHIVFYENRTFYAMSYFIGRGESADRGTWTKTERGRYSTRSVNGIITNWTYDSTDDSVYAADLPHRKYYRYRG